MGDENLRRRTLLRGMGLGAAVVFGGTAAFSGTARAATLGGTTTEGALQITVNNGNIAVRRYNGSTFVVQYYSGNDSDTVVYADGTVYDIPGGGLTDASGTELAVADEYTTNGGDTVVTEFEDPGAGFTLVQRVTYSGTQQYFDLTWEVTNVGVGDLSGLRLLHGKDTYLAGGDSGFGFWSPVVNTIGVRKTVSGEENRLSLRGINDPYNYQSNRYSSVAGSLSNGALTGTVDTSFHDNGYAMEWRRPSLAAGETWTVRARESFTLASVVLTGPGEQTLNGSSVDLVFEVANVGTSQEAVSFTTNGPTGWTVSTPAGTTLPAGGTGTVTVTATPPGSVGAGLYDVTLTASSQDSIDSATGQVRVSDGTPTEDSTPSSAEARFSLVCDERNCREELTDGNERVTLSNPMPEVGEEIQLAVTVTNVGDKRGAYFGELTDGFRSYGAQRVVLDEDEKTTLTYTVSFEKPGLYQMFLTGDHIVDIPVGLPFSIFSR